MKKLVLGIVGLSMLTWSCTEERLVILDQEANRFKTIENQETLAPRLEVFNTPVYLRGKSASASFTHVATVLPPTVSGTTVGATSVSKQGNYVYVA